MSFVRLRRFFCTRPGALRLRPAACRKREEPAIFARSTAASFAFFPAKTSEAKPRPPFNACWNDRRSRRVFLCFYSAIF